MRGMLCAPLLFWAAAALAAETAYVCRDAQGRPGYSDRPCGAGSRPVALPEAQATGSKSPLRTSARQWTDAVACENRWSELQHGIVNAERESRDIRSRQDGLSGRLQRDMEAVPSGRGSEAARRELQRKAREQDRRYQRALRDNERRIRELQRQQKRYKCQDL